jgi:2,3-bisphosphoglycerate-dependent phosphoglycerate mutase
LIKGLVAESGSIRDGSLDQHVDGAPGRGDEVGVGIVFETHSWTEDNDHGLATGWGQGRLSERGRVLAAELGRRRREDGLAAVFSSDLWRAIQTATIAFAGTDIPILYDWRLRECDYGRANGGPAAELDKAGHLDVPYPGGESWRAAVGRVGRFLADLPTRWEGQRILLIGHVATRWALDHYLGGVDLADLVATDFGWREGWEYRLG